MKLRDYQESSIAEIRNQFLKGKTKVLLYLATGAGKTTIFCRMIASAQAIKKKTLVIVRGRKLVKQASDRLTREGVEHGVLMANHWNFRPHLPNQIGSIDTLISRNLRPDADLIIIDEAHMAGSPGYKKFLAQYPNAYIVSVTATPWVPEGLSHIAETVVHPITMQELIDQNYLVRLRYFAPSSPDLTNVKISSATKDYVVNELENVMNVNPLTGKIVDHWKKLCSNRPTLCFAVNIHHSKTLAERFKQAGILAEHCDADTSDDERENIIRRLQSGEIQIICNVGILCTGVDIPCVSAIIMARPTKSRNLFVQQAGRGTRLFTNKEDCLILDHAGNTERHGLPTDEIEFDLQGRTKEKSVSKSKICKNCFAVFRAVRCPECGTEPPIIITDIEETSDELIEIKELDPVKRALNQLVKEAQMSGRKRAWAYHKLVNRFGFDAVKTHLPQWFITSWAIREEPFKGSPFKPVDNSQL